MALQVQGGSTRDYTFITPPTRDPSDKNPFKKVAKKQPSPREVYEPGTPYWWLDRLLLRLMDRMDRYDTLENYALGYHPYPNVDQKYIRALQELSLIHISEPTRLLSISYAV